MRRKTFDAILATGGLVVAVVLAVVGGLGLWAHAFIGDQVHTQLAQQQIFFPPKAAFEHAKPGTEITPSMIPSVSQYAGRQLVTGAEAKVYADDFIAVHLKEIGGGQTYSQISNKFLAMKPTDPNYAAVAQQRQTLFMGETLRGMLLNAYAFGTMGTIAGIAAIVAFAAAAVMLLLSALGFRHLRHTPVDAVVLPRLTEPQKVDV